MQNSLNYYPQIKYELPRAIEGIQTQGIDEADGKIISAINQAVNSLSIDYLTNYSLSVEQILKKIIVDTKYLDDVLMSISNSRDVLDKQKNILPYSGLQENITYWVKLLDQKERTYQEYIQLINGISTDELIDFEPTPEYIATEERYVKSNQELAVFSQKICTVIDMVQLQSELITGLGMVAEPLNGVIPESDSINKLRDYNLSSIDFVKADFLFKMSRASVQKELADELLNLQDYKLNVLPCVQNDFSNMDLAEKDSYQSIVDDIENDYQDSALDLYIFYKTYVSALQGVINLEERTNFAQR